MHHSLVQHKVSLELHIGWLLRFALYLPNPFNYANRCLQVILAMDEGQYDDRADIWSLGITCIELGKTFTQLCVQLPLRIAMHCN